MSRLRAEEGADGAEAEEEGVAAQVDKLVIIDREVDLVTPMVIPLTYEALIDQVVGLEAGARLALYAHSAAPRHSPPTPPRPPPRCDKGTVMLDESVAGDQGAKKKKGEEGMARRGGAGAGAADTSLVPVPLNSNGKLFAQIRDFNIRSVAGRGGADRRRAGAVQRPGTRRRTHGAPLFPQCAPAPPAGAVPRNPAPVRGAAQGRAAHRARAAGLCEKDPPLEGGFPRAEHPHPPHRARYRHYQRPRVPRAVASGARCVGRAGQPCLPVQPPRTTWLGASSPPPPHTLSPPLAPPRAGSEVLEGDYNAEFLFTAIAKQEPLLSVLRLACLHSLVHGGFKAKAFDQLRREIVQVRAGPRRDRQALSP